MKRILLTAIVIFILLLNACSETDGPTGNDNQNEPPALAAVFDLQFTIPDSSELQQFQAEIISYEGSDVTAYNLGQFIPQITVNEFLEIDDFDSRKLFSIEIVSSDEDGNYSPRSHGYVDLRWDQFSSGYLLPAEKGRTYFPDPSIETGYNVKEATYLKLYRGIDVNLNDVITTFEIEAIETESITYFKDEDTFTENAFSITELISDFVTEEQASYEYFFLTADEFINDDSNNTFDWETLQNSYWLPEKNKAIFLNSEMMTIYKSVKYVQEITLESISK